MKEKFDAVWEFVDENQDEVISKISEKASYWKNSAEWGVFCPDGFEISEIVVVGENLYEVYAVGSYEEGWLVKTMNGPYTNDRVYRIRFRFFVREETNENFVFDYYCDEKGEVDDRSTILEPYEQEYD